MLTTDGLQWTEGRVRQSSLCRFRSMTRWRSLFSVSATLAIVIPLNATLHTANDSPPTLSALRASLVVAPRASELPASTSPPIQSPAIGVDTSDLRGQRGCGDVGADTSDISSEVPCTFGDRSAKKVVVVVGDSMAGAWVLALDVWGRRHGWKVVRLVKDGCPPWKTVIRYTPGACVAFNKFEVRTINLLRPAAVFAVGLRYRGQLTMRSGGSPAVAETIEGFALEIRASRAKVLVPQNTPWFFGLGSPLLCLASTPANVKKCNRDARSKVVESAMLGGIAIAAATHRIVAVAIDQLFCNPTVCPVLVGRYLVYADDHHFTRVWALHISTAFASVFDPLV